MTLKQLKTELEELKFVIKMSVFGFILKNWKKATTEQDEIGDDNTDNIKLVEK